MTQVIKVNPRDTDNLAETIKDVCEIQESVNLELRGIVEIQGQLLLVFQGKGSRAKQ